MKANRIMSLNCHLLRITDLQKAKLTSSYNIALVFYKE